MFTRMYVLPVHACDNTRKCECIVEVRCLDSLDQVLIKIFPSTVVPRCSRLQGKALGSSRLIPRANIITYDGILGLRLLLSSAVYIHVMIS